jgi:NAD+ synthase (glutamine-hydrolysing)
MAEIVVAACQVNPVVGDLEGNLGRVLDAVGEAESAGADVAVLPELALTGYPPEDLLLEPAFVEDNLAALEELAARVTGPTVVVVGFVDAGEHLWNAAAVVVGGAVRGRYRKRLLPNYSVFDERRYFTPGSGRPELYRLSGVLVGVSICQDIWSPGGPVDAEARAGAQCLVNLNASPFASGRLAERATMLSVRAADAHAAVVYVNAVGGQDELVFDGGSMVFDGRGELVARAPQFEEAIVTVALDLPPSWRLPLIDPRRGRSGRPLDVVDLDRWRGSARQRPARPSALVRHRPVANELGADEEVYRALVVATRDYVEKNGFADVVVGLSGGIDSAMVATIATDALGPARVHGVSMPSRYSSQGSLDDARRLAKNLGIELLEIPIEQGHVALSSTLAAAGVDTTGLTDENLQSRLRGLILMALSNARGWLVLTTGNKSELAVGYATLYGDTAGGFDVLKDVAKTRVFSLARWRNASEGWPVVPEEIIAKPPSAELRPDQRDDQTLPPYEVLDPILAAYVEGDHSPEEIASAGPAASLVAQIVAMVDRAEYKRRQAPPGPRVTRRAFGKDRRVPITHRYRAGARRRGNGRSAGGVE